MSEIAELIQSEINKLSTSSVKTNVGNITMIADGVAKVDGLSKAMFNEMVEFPGGVFGIALNLEEDEVGCVILGDYSQLKEGDEARTTGKLLSVPVGKELLGRVVDAIGKPIDGKGPIDAKEQYPIEKIAPGIIPRQSVDQPLQTGILSIDSMIPIGRGQRELIIGDRSTGKTTIAIDTIINQANINRQGEVNGGPLPPCLLHLCSRWTKECQHRPYHQSSGRSRCTEIHHYRQCSSCGQSGQSIPRPLCRSLNGRVVHEQRNGCTHRI